MIIIKYIPNILKDEGRIIKELPFISNKPLQDYLNETGFELNESKIIVTGKAVTDFTIILKNGDEVIITSNIKIPAAFFVWLGFSAATAATLATVTAVIGYALMALSLAYSIYSFCVRPKTPNFGTTGDGIDEGSPTYGWDGIINTQDVGTPIPIVYGEHRVGGNIINQFIRTDGDKEYLNLLIALSEGEIEDIDSVEINENPSTNFNDIVLTKRYGTNLQTQIPNFNDSHDIKALSVPLLQNNAYIYTTVNTSITAFELKVTLAGGLFKSNSVSGAIESWAVTYKVEYKLHTDVSYIDLGSTTLSGLSRTDLRRVFRKEGLTAGKYDIRITRTSEDSSLSPMMQGDLYLKGVDEITQSDPLIYPNVALIGVEALATDQLSGSTPTITSLVKGRKVNIPAVLTALGGTAVAWENYYYDPTSSTFKLLATGATLYWDGVTYVNAYSANPIWCLKDLITNTRYGLGDYITTLQFDTTQLLEMAQYCEEKVSDGDGGYEKRFRLDVVIDSATKAIDLLTQLSATFRCFAFYSNGAIKLIIDKVESPVQMFGMGNIISDSFIQSWKSIKEIPNVIEVQFMNEDLNYKQEVISVMDETSIANGDPIRKKSLRLFCTRTSQALREGKYALNLARAIHRTVSLKAGIDAIACQAGDIINVAHDVPQWGFSGRVKTGSTTSKVYLDQAVIIEAGKTYKLRVKFADDTQEEKTVSNGAGTYTELNVSSPFTNAPANYDVYSFGEENKVVAPYRIVSMKRSENSEVEITALEYDADVYDTDTIALPDNNFSSLSNTIPDVTDLILTERLVKLGDGTIENCIDVWFNKPSGSSYHLKNYTKAKIYISDNAGLSWAYKGEVGDVHFAIQGGINDLATYRIAVVSANEKCDNAISDSPYEVITVVGKTAPPSDVTGFSVQQDGDDEVFSWAKNTDIDLFGYEIREGDTWETGTVVETDIQQTTWRMPLFAYGVKEYHIKAIDTTRNYSLNAASSTITISQANTIEDIGNFSLDDWVDGTFEASAGTEPVVDSSGAQVVDSGDNEIIKNGIVGFEITDVLSSEQVIDSASNFIADSLGNLVEQQLTNPTEFLQLRDLGGYYASEGIFISEVIDLTFKMNARITANANLIGDQYSSAVYIRLSDDNVTWGAWGIFASGVYACRYFQMKILVTNLDTTKTVRIMAFKASVTVRLIFDGGNEIAISAGGTDINFTKTFLTLVRVFIIAQGSARRAVYASKDLTKITGVKVLDNSNADVGGTVDCLVQGY